MFDDFRAQNGKSGVTMCDAGGPGIPWYRYGLLELYLHCTLLHPKTKKIRKVANYKTVDEPE